MVNFEGNNNNNNKADHTDFVKYPKAKDSDGH